MIRLNNISKIFRSEEFDTAFFVVFDTLLLTVLFTDAALLFGIIIP